jgi:putative aldouronate transport system substrate-binding protein
VYNFIIKTIKIKILKYRGKQKMKSSKLLTLVLAASVVAGVASGCAKKEEVKPTDNAPATAEMDKSPITFTFYNADGSAPDDFTNPVAKAITEKTGVTLKIDYPVGGNTQRVPLMIASGEYPDLIYAKGDTPKLVDAGALVKLDDLIGKYGPDIKKLYGDYLKRLRYSKDDQSVYALGAYGVGAAIWNPAGSLQIQHAVLKDQGYPQIKTVADFEKAIKAYKEKYPTIDGQPTIGMSLLADDWRWLISVGNPSGFVLGHQDDGQWFVNEETNEASYKFLDPKMKDYYRWLNGMYAQGLIDKESFTQKYDQYKAKLASGRVLGLADAAWEYGEAVTSLRNDKKEDRTWASLPVSIDENTKNRGMFDQGWSGGWGVAITTKNKNPERAMQFLNWMASDEAQVLNNWGIEGTNYKVENGKRVIPEDEMQKKLTDKDYGKKTGIGLYGYPFPQYGDGKQDSTGNTYTANSEQDIVKNYNSAEKETLAGYKINMFKDLFPQTSEFKVPAWGAVWQLSPASDSDLAIIQKKADDYMQKAIPQAILVDPAKFDATWDKMMEDLKAMNIDKANAEMTQLVKDKVELWK